MNRLPVRVAIAALVPAGAYASFRCLWILWWNFFPKQDLWPVSSFVALLVLGLASAAAAVLAGEAVRRTFGGALAKSAAAAIAPKIGSTVAGTESALLDVSSLLLIAARVLLVLQVGVLVVAESGPARSVGTTLARHAVTWGMARDLPVPSQPDRPDTTP